MKTLLTSFYFITLSIFSTSTYAQTCQNGDCKNGYGMINHENVELYHGFFTDGKYDGIGYLQNAKGAYYMSQFKNGKINGYTVYNETGNTTGGIFVNGVKEGIHIEFPIIPKTIKRIAITYENGKEVSRETLVGNFKTPNPCKAGDCDNGFGIKMDGMVLTTGVFEFGDFKHGHIVNLREGVEKMFLSPGIDATQANYFVYENVPVEKGKLEVASIYKAGKNNGQYIVVNMALGQMGAALFKDGEQIKRYEVK